MPRLVQIPFIGGPLDSRVLPLVAPLRPRVVVTSEGVAGLPDVAELVGRRPHSYRLGCDHHLQPVYAYESAGDRLGQSRP